MDGTDGSEPLQKLLARVPERVAIEVRSGASPRGDSVGNLVVARVGHPDPRHGHAQLRGHHLDHLGVETLAHLYPAVREENGTVQVNTNIGGGLVEEVDGNGREELHWNNCNTSLSVLVLCVELLNVFPDLEVVALLQTFVPTLDEKVLSDGLGSVVKKVSHFGQVLLSHKRRVQVEPQSNFLDDILNDERSLRTAKPSKGRVRDEVGFKS